MRVDTGSARSRGPCALAALWVNGFVADVQAGAVVVFHNPDLSSFPAVTDTFGIPCVASSQERAAEIPDLRTCSRGAREWSLG
jgi:hypothetical protein